MAGGKTWELVGTKELSQKLKNLSYQVGRKGGLKAVEEGIEPAKEWAEQTIPERTGLARENIDVVLSSAPKQGIFRARLGVLKESFYAVSFVEFGTSKMAKQPWLRPALQVTAREAIGIVTNVLRDVIRREAKR